MKSNRVLFGFAAIAVVVFLLFGTSIVSAQVKTSIRVSSESIIETELISLGRISQITGDSLRTERIRNISLGYAPDIGMTRELNRRQIMLAISAAGLSENEFTLVTPDRILIKRFGQNISDDEIRETIHRTVLGQFSTDGVSAQIVRIDLPQNIQVPIGTVDIRVSASGVRDLFSRFPVSIEIRVDNQTVRRLAATVEIEAFADVYVAAKDLSANSKLSQLDIRVERRRIQKPITSYIRDPEKIRGAQLIRATASGAEIMTDAVVAGVVIKLGDAIRVEATSGKLKIVVNGEARSNGKIGDRIAVRNLKSGAIMQAIVVDEGFVRVIF